MLKGKPLVQFLLLSIGVLAAKEVVVQRNQSTENYTQITIPSRSAISKVPKQRRVDEAMKMEFEKTVDPTIGRVPRERLMVAERYLRDQVAQQRTTAASLVWKERGPSNIGGRTRAALVDPNDASGKSVFVGSVGGGLWKTTDITAAKPQWTAVNDWFANLAITSIAADPTNPQNLYFSTGEGYFNASAIPGLGIWRSTDGGLSWAQLPSTNGVNGFYFIQRVFVTQNGTLLAATRPMGILRSTNAGTSWTKVLGTGLGITGATTDIGYDIEQASDGTIFATIEGSVHVSTNDGATFGAAKSLGVTASRIELAVAPSDPNYVYAAVERNLMVEALLKSTDKGNTWTSITKPVDADPTIPATDFARGQAWYNLCIAVDPANRNTVWVGGIDLFRTQNGGNTWNQMTHWWGGYALPNVHADQHLLLFHPSQSNQLLIGNDGGLYATETAQLAQPKFEFKGTGYNVTQFYSVAIHPDADQDIIMGGTQDNGTQILREVEPGISRELSGGDGGYCHFDEIDPQFVFTSYVYNNFYRSNNGGKSFESVPVSNNGRFVNPTAYDPNSGKFYAANLANNYLRWENPKTGNTFTTVPVSPFGGIPTTLALSPNVPNRIYFGFGNGSIYRVDNAHATPVSVNIGIGLPTRYVSSIAIEEGDDNHLIVVFSNYGTISVFETKDGGSSWVSVEGNLPDMPVRTVIFQPGYNSRLLIGTDLGVWKTDSINASATQWTQAGTGMPNVRIEMLKYRKADNLVVVATHGRGIFVTDYFSQEKAKFAVDRTVGYLGTPLQFISYSRKGTTWEWNFGDGSPLDFSEHPMHAYSAPGDYTVTLTINGGNSSDTIVNMVRILPDMGTPFLQANGGNFEVSQTYFGAENLYGSGWQMGCSSVPGKNGTASGLNAWVTGVNETEYFPKSESYLYAPIFDMTNSGVYTLKFDAKYRLESEKDGFRVEYSIDRGQTWQGLGSQQPNWYNFLNNSENSAFPMMEPYFTGNFSAVFQTYQYDISALAGNPEVAFRFSFRTDAYNPEAGVAIDNFELQGPANGTPLPVEWTPLAGHWEANDIVLEWQTITERNNLGFEIMRSTDGQQFTTVGFVEGLEFSNQIRPYAFVDGQLQGNRYFYQLRQTDFDGQQSLSNIVELSRVSPLAGEMQVWPSPFSSELHLQLPTQQANRLRLELHDLAGNCVGKWQYNDYQGNQLTLSDWLESLASGVYLLRVQADQVVFTKKLVKG